MVAVLVTSLFISFAGSALASAVLPAVTGVEGVIPFRPGHARSQAYPSARGPGLSQGYAGTGAQVSPPMVSGNANPGVIPAGGKAEFAVPTGWIGNVAITPSGYKLTNDITLIEANYAIPGGYSYAVADVDVSFVNGFSVSTVCSCDNKVVTGCNKNLWNLNTCANNNGQGGCVNPLRDDKSATQAAPFFRPCQHAAWTYVEDGDADAWGLCQSGHITCCVGPNCAPNPKQS
ncbi:hypothetical protein PG994_004794 [Apiospora phragmitis]|uniref:Thaumatin-like protein n=1 Tax=Apiospora phragmitis TaxID=2905665 RepID=A0ABR1VUM5_9PEZI